MQITDPLLTAREGAAELQSSEPTFWRWVKNGISLQSREAGRNEPPAPF